MDADNSRDLKAYKQDSLLWEILSGIGWGIAWGLIAGFVILALHLGR